MTAKQKGKWLRVGNGYETLARLDGVPDWTIVRVPSGGCSLRFRANPNGTWFRTLADAKEYVQRDLT